MKTIKVRAGLKLATFEDVFSGKNSSFRKVGNETFVLRNENRSPIHNKMLFLKDNFTQEFEGVYIIPELSMIPVNYTDQKEKDLWRSSNEYWLRELHNGLLFHQFYVLSEKYNSLEYNFKLELMAAEDCHFYDGPNRIKPNVLYYARTSPTELQGPFYMKANADFTYVMNAVANEKLFVPVHNQTFEPHKMQEAS